MYIGELLWFPPPPDLFKKTFISVMANIIFGRFEYVLVIENSCEKNWLQSRS